MLRNQKGAALLQVLLVTVVLAGMAAMLLRSSLSRTSTARKTRRAVASQMLINACQAEVNALWSVKKPDVFARDLQSCLMYCNASVGEECLVEGQVEEGTSVNASNQYVCAPIEMDGTYYQVTATFELSEDALGSCNPETGENCDEHSAQGQCPLRYTVESGTMSGSTFTPDSEMRL